VDGNVYFGHAALLGFVMAVGMPISIAMEAKGVHSVESRYQIIEKKATGEG
jgi:hypothetical protein